MSDTLGALSGSNPMLANSPIGQQIIGAQSAGLAPRGNVQNADAQGAQARAMGPAAGMPPEVPARQIMMPTDPGDLAMMGPNFAKGRHGRKR